MAIVTAGISEREITRGTGKVILLVDMQRTHTAAKRYRALNPHFSKGVGAPGPWI
jgi:hypothetical protein